MSEELERELMLSALIDAEMDAEENGDESNLTVEQREIIRLQKQVSALQFRLFAPDVSPVPPTAEPLWNLKQILDLIDYSTTSTVFEVATARDEVNQLRDLFQAHMPDGQPRCLDENPLPPSGPLSDPEGVFEAMGMDEPKFTADRIVYEDNQGGDAWGEIIRFIHA
jgi:hypothetical protein